MRGWLEQIGLILPRQETPKNRFSLNEWSGALGDLGTLLPLIFALIVFNGFSTATVFFLFGTVYLLTGWFYKVPVSVQPLKAMSVIAIAKGFSPEFLASTSFFYGVLLIVLSLTGLIKWLQKIFSPALVRGIQFGIGLILTQKAIELVIQKGFLLHTPSFSLSVNLIMVLVLLVVIWIFQVRKNLPVALILVLASILVFGFLNMVPEDIQTGGKLLNLRLPDIFTLKDALIYLIIPQLPLTLGNAVYAASDSCHVLWDKQAKRVNPTRLSFSIGLSDLFIGLTGGFPVCHGAGGMGAHAQFGAKTGGATMIMGAILLVTALVSPLRGFIFLIPVPLLAAMLIFDSYRMMTMIGKLKALKFVFVALTVGLISFFTRNLTLALITGFVIEKFIIVFENRKAKIAEGVQND